MGNPAGFKAGTLGAGNPLPNFPWPQASRMAGLLASCAMCEGSLDLCLFPALSFTWDGLQSAYFLCEASPLRTHFLVLWS